VCLSGEFGHRRNSSILRRVQLLNILL
jgi:hypothetical protein